MENVYGAGHGLQLGIHPKITQCASCVRRDDDARTHLTYLFGPLVNGHPKPSSLQCQCRCHATNATANDRELRIYFGGHFDSCA